MINLIKETFISHPISEKTEINIFLPSQRHPNSEGIHFESRKFSGEIFYYNYPNQYLEIEILNHRTTNFFFKVIDINSDTKISYSIKKLLDKVLESLD